jgi:hypothetical protein
MSFPVGEFAEGTWCAACDVFFQEQGEWNDKNPAKIKIKLLCHHGYERLRWQGRPTGTKK